MRNFFRRWIARILRRLITWVEPGSGWQIVDAKTSGKLILPDEHEGPYCIACRRFHSSAADCLHFDGEEDEGS